MTQRNYTNTATPVPLSAAISATATTLTVSSTTGFPNVPFLLALERGTASEEVCLCTAVSATTFTVTRAYDGTTGKTHAIGAMVEHTVAAIDYREAGSPPRMTTSERDALTGADLWDGRTVYNTDSSSVEVYKASSTSWGPLGGAATVATADPATASTQDGAFWYDSDDDLPEGLGDTDLRMARTGKDANGVFTTISYYRSDNTLAFKSVLSGGTSPKYTTRTATEYAGDGTTALQTVTYSLTYDTDGDLTTETWA